jgi:hypothetical protein
LYTFKKVEHWSVNVGNIVEKKQMNYSESDVTVLKLMIKNKKIGKLKQMLKLYSRFVIFKV